MNVNMSCNNNNNNNSNDNSIDDEAIVVKKRLYVATGLCCTFLLVEAIGGYISGSLAIYSDAAHLFADLAAFCVAIGAAHIATMPPTTQHTYGFKRMESLAALLSMVSLAYVSVWLSYEAIRRLFFIRATNVDGKLMSGVASIGVIVNIILAFVLGPEHHVHLPGHTHDHCHDHDHDHHDDDHNHDHHHDHHSTSTEETPLIDKKTIEQQQQQQQQSNCDAHHDHTHSHTHNHNDDNNNNDCDEEDPLTLQLTQHADEVIIPIKKKHKKKRNVNLHAAYIHVLSDLAQSIAVLIAGIIIWIKPTWTFVDPIITILFCTMVFYSTLSVIRNSIAILLEEVPPNINWQLVYDDICNVHNVINVHDLHIWSISDGIPSLSVHCLIEKSNNNNNVNNNDTLSHQVLRDVFAICQKHGIGHATIQVQYNTTTTTTESNNNCITCPDHLLDVHHLPME